MKGGRVRRKMATGLALDKQETEIASCVLCALCTTYCVQKWTKTCDVSGRQHLWLTFKSRRKKNPMTPPV